MTIAEKVIRAKEDYDAVHNTAREEGYNHGYDDGSTDGYNRGYDTGYENGKAMGGYTKGFETGKQAERDAFWDAFQTSSRRLWYAAFQNACWNDTTFYPKYDITPTGDASSLFRYCGITDLEGRLSECGVNLDTSEATGLNCAFGESTITALPTINLSKCIQDASRSHGVFGGSKDLISIRKVIVSEAVVLKNTFTTCNSLQNIDFEGVIGQDIDLHWSTNLSRASIESIVNALSEEPIYAQGKTLTLSKAAVDREFYGQCVRIDPETGELIWYEGAGSLSLAWEQLIAPKIGIPESPMWKITLV